MSELDIIESQSIRIRELETLTDQLLRRLAERCHGQPIEANIFDKVTRIPNCTVEILENTTTGDVSVGWYRGEGDEYDGSAQMD